MFSGAIISLMVAVGAAVLGFGGLPDATAAIFAQHIFLIAIGLFAISALVAIFDLELPHIGGLVMRSKLSETGFPKAAISRCDLSGDDQPRDFVIAMSNKLPGARRDSVSSPS